MNDGDWRVFEYVNTRARHLHPPGLGSFGEQVGGQACLPYVF